MEPATSGGVDDDGRDPESGDPDGVVKAYSGISFRRPHIHDRAQRAAGEIMQSHLCRYDVGA